MKPERLFHISEAANIKTFVPRPSPSQFDGLKGNVVFAITEQLLHNYLFPRDCPRVCYYATTATNQIDKEKFFAQTTAEFILNVEEEWVEWIKQTTLFCYEFPVATFELLDKCAGYYISYQAVEPLSITTIHNPFEAISALKNVELRFLPTLWDLADDVGKSSLGFSLIRMRNAAFKT